jgi:hypothetical protein
MVEPESGVRAESECQLKKREGVIDRSPRPRAVVRALIFSKALRRTEAMTNEFPRLLSAGMDQSQMAAAALFDQLMTAWNRINMDHEDSVALLRELFSDSNSGPVEMRAAALDFIRSAVSEPSAWEGKQPTFTVAGWTQSQLAAAGAFDQLIIAWSRINSYDKATIDFSREIVLTASSHPAEACRAILNFIQSVAPFWWESKQSPDC